MGFRHPGCYLVRVWGVQPDQNNRRELESIEFWMDNCGMMFVNGAVLIWIGRGLREARRFYFYLALLVLVGNILLTITDDFGIFDLVTLIIAISLLILLLVTRSKYLSAP